MDRTIGQQVAAAEEECFADEEVEGTFGDL